MTSTVPCTAGNWAAAFLPILVLLVLMIQFRWRATEAAPMGLFAALIIALTVFRANSALIAFISGTAYTALLATRAVQLAVMLPVQCAVIYLLGRAKPVRDILDKISENP